jgi:hypothetical protein
MRAAWLTVLPTAWLLIGCSPAPNSSQAGAPGAGDTGSSPVAVSEAGATYGEIMLQSGTTIRTVTTTVTTTTETPPSPDAARKDTLPRPGAARKDTLPRPKSATTTTTTTTTKTDTIRRP